MKRHGISLTAVLRPLDLAAVLAWCLLMATLSCGSRDTRSSETTPTVAIDFSKRGESPTKTRLPAAGRALRMALAGITSPAETLRYYHDLPGFLGTKLGQPVEMVQRQTYQEVNDLLVGGELDFAFLCSGGYVAAGEALAAEILAVPVVGGKTTYQALIIVHRDSRIQNFAGLRQHSFAFTDPLSNTGWLYPVLRLTGLGATAASFFSQVTYTHGHDRSIEAVARKIVDGASVNSLTYEYAARNTSKSVEQLRIVERSPEFGIPPVVSSPKMERALRRTLTGILLDMHKDPEGSRILRGLSIDRFTAGDQQAYDSIRAMGSKIGSWRP